MGLIGLGSSFEMSNIPVENVMTRAIESPNGWPTRQVLRTLAA
jgi:hypothetical protein